MRFHVRSRYTALASAIALSLATLGWAAPARAQDSEIGFGDLQRSGLSTLLVGGDYYWDVDVNQPAPATMYGVPAQLLSDVGARTVSLTFDWGDGSPATTFDSDQNFADQQFSLSCYSGYDVDENGNYIPQDNFGYFCRAGAGHRYAAQGIYVVTVSAVQETDEGTASGTTSTADVVVDLRLGGSLSGKGTVQAPAGSGGMYDTDYQGGQVTFAVTARRQARSAATKASVTISAPNMTPDYPPANPPTGMTFTGTAAMAPLFVAKTKTGGEVYLTRVEGVVTNSHGYSGGAWATIHAVVRKGSPTLVRIVVNNTSAGFTYLDTGWNQYDQFALDADHDLLTGGSIKIG